MRNDLADLAAEFRGKAVTVIAEAVAETRVLGDRMVALVKEKASGRPGPRVVSGDYRESIYANFWSEAEIVGFDVTSDAPQSMRLENGFVGRDTLGRIYNQPPFPHFRPAADELEGEWEEIMATVTELDVGHHGATPIPSEGLDLG